MPVAPMSGKGNGVAFMVAAGLVFEIIAAACSSPQTAEINADKRAATLMKWVKIGLAGSALFVGIAVMYEPDHMSEIAAGAGLAAVLMGGAYAYAKKSGLSSPQPGTETDYSTEGYANGVQVYSQA